jgi:hypothetical protein
MATLLGRVVWSEDFAAYLELDCKNSDIGLRSSFVVCLSIAWIGCVR